MKNYFLKSYFFGIVALTIATTNILKSDGINSGDIVSLRPTAHSQDHTLTGYYEKSLRDFDTDGRWEKWEANGNHRCFLTKDGIQTWRLSKIKDKTTPLHYGDEIKLKSRFMTTSNVIKKVGGYLCAESDYSVNANREEPKEWETWTLVNPNNTDDKSPVPHKGEVALKSIEWGRFLCAEDTKNIIANRTGIGPWEKWTIESHGPDQDHAFDDRKEDNK